MPKLIPVIMCGGAGSRLWPASREALPKQFIPLFGPESTFQTTMRRVSDEAVYDRPIVVTNHDFRFLVTEQLAQVGMLAEIVLEPVRRDSAAAVAIAAEVALRRSPDAIVAILAADHMVSDDAAFAVLCTRAAEAAADGYIVTLGIEPTRPAKGYGYIRPGEPTGREGVHRVASFVEKPDEATATRYLREGYLWNSGNFFFPAKLMKRELERFEPKIAAAARRAVDAAKPDLQFLVLDREAMESAPAKSIDYAVMEHTDCAAVLPAAIGWSDVGAWSSVLELSSRDAQGNHIKGHGLVLDGSDVLVHSEDHLTAVVGLSQVAVITTQDAVLVADLRRDDAIKTLVARLKANKAREVVEHKRVYRPWGYYQGVDQGSRYQVKRIVVKPQGRLSVQKHFHRAEHWVVVKGTAEVLRDGVTTMVHENESIYLPIGSVHALTNPGKIDLELIEVQTGSYLGEDDIVRISDIYHRS